MIWYGLWSPDRARNHFIAEAAAISCLSPRFTLLSTEIQLCTTMPGSYPELYLTCRSTEIDYSWKHSYDYDNCFTDFLTDLTVCTHKLILLIIRKNFIKFYILYFSQHSMSLPNSSNLTNIDIYHIYVLSVIIYIDKHHIYSLQTHESFTYILFHCLYPVCWRLWHTEDSATTKMNLMLQVMSKRRL